MINAITPTDEWIRNFRMTREESENLCEELRPSISPGWTPNYLRLSVEKEVCKFLVKCYYSKIANYLHLVFDEMRNKVFLFILCI